MSKFRFGMFPSLGGGPGVVYRAFESAYPSVRIHPSKTAHETVVSSMVMSFSDHVLV